MKMKRTAVLILVAGVSVATRADFAEYVDPFVGTTATGHTTPAAAYPFGMVQAGPTTGTITWQYCSGYRYEDKAVTGYALTALSGTGFCEYNELQVLPFSGDAAAKGLAALPFKRQIDKDSEKAKPGYYAVRQPQDGVNVEIAAAKRAAIYRFAWEKGRRAKVLVNLPYGNGQADGNQFAGSHDGKVTKFGDGRIEGEHFRTGCIMRRRIAFALEFSRPWSACEELPKEKPDELPRYVLSFDLGDGESLFLKSAFSINSPDAARRNLVSSIPSWDFDGVRDRTRAAWNEVLSRSTCEGTDEQKRNWYTSLYHLYFQPNDYSDADEAKPYYTTLSLWDTFRACHPWYSIVTPEVNAGAVDSFMRHYKTFGRLPVMSYGGMNFDCMIGNHSVPVIVDAFLKSRRRDGVGAVATKWESVYEAIKETLTKAHPGKPNEDWEVYDKYGYFPLDRVKREGVSRTLECAYDDWCAAQMAKALGKTEDYAFFLKRSQNWKNVFDKSIGFARGKSADGAWREPFDPFTFGHGGLSNKDFTEGNAFQYSWHVMHDFPGLVEAMGGKDAALRKLQGLFVAHDTTEGAPPDVTGLIGQYVHGNEPSHHVIYAFTLLDRPDLTAKYVRDVFDRFYAPRPDGLCGNDDCGQMSAWYLFSAMGFYPFNPCGGEYVIGAPQVPAAQVKVEGEGEQRTFRILAKGLSKENKYVKSVTLNGRPVTDGKIRHADIVSGGVLEFEMFGRKHASGGPVQEALDRMVGTGTIAGVASALSDGDYAVTFQNAGYADVEKRRPMTPDTLCAVFSMTKTFAGVCVLCAVDDGKMSLDDHLSKYLPAFADTRMKDGSKPKRALTVRDCMCHSTGSLDPGWPGWETVRSAADKFAKLPLDRQPGECFSYGNQWVDTAMAALEVAVGEPWEDYLQKRVLDPLGMKDTTFFPNEEQVTRLARKYTSDAYPLRALPKLDEGALASIRGGKAAGAHGFAGLYSTARDMIRFSQMLAHRGTWKDRTVVSRKTFDALMLTKQTASGVREPYSVGAWMWGDWIGHEGAQRTAEWANPKTGHARVFMIQTWNQAGPAFFQLKALWHDACDREQGTPTTVFGT